ncbi:F0F1 ATP synthase subunit A, partial [Salmonella enterica]
QWILNVTLSIFHIMIITLQAFNLMYMKIFSQSIETEEH